MVWCGILHDYVYLAAPCSFYRTTEHQGASGDHLCVAIKGSVVWYVSMVSIRFTVAFGLFYLLLQSKASSDEGGESIRDSIGS